jgi:predicted RNA-binding protein with PUA-like domain
VKSPEITPDFGLVPKLIEDPQSFSHGTPANTNRTSRQNRKVPAIITIHKPTEKVTAIRRYFSRAVIRISESFGHAFFYQSNVVPWGYVQLMVIAG